MRAPCRLNRAEEKRLRETVTAALDPRLLATFANGQWRIAGGEYKLILASSSRDLGETVTVRVPARTLPGSWRP